MRNLITMFALTIIFSGCSTMDPTDGRSFDVNSKKQCAQICKQADMSFQALVVISGRAGCVCGNKDAIAISAAGSMSGAVAAIADEEVQQQQQQKK